MPTQVHGHVISKGIEAIAQRLVIGRKRDGRSIYDAQAKSELLEACRRPCASVARLARESGVNANLLSTWLRVHERTRTAAAAASREVVAMAPSAFVPVQVEPAAPVPPAPAVSVQARLPNGVVIELGGCDLQQAGQLLETLGRLRCSASTKG